MKNNKSIERGGKGGNKRKRGDEKFNRNTNERERGRHNFRRGNGGRNYGGANNRVRNFRGYNRFDNDRGEQYGPEMESNFEPILRGAGEREILNYDSGINHDHNFENNINEDGSFPKFKDDTSNIFMSRHNNRINFENSPKPLLQGYYEYPQHNNNPLNKIDYKVNQQEIQKETNQQNIHRETNQQEIQKNNPIEQDNCKNVPAPLNVVINIKKETPNEVIKPIQKQVSSSSSDSTNDSDDSSMEKLKKAIKGGTKSSKKENEKKLILPLPKIKKEPGTKELEKESSSSDSTSSSSSDDSSTAEISSAGKNKKKSKKKNFEEEVVCLGKLEKFENLIDDDETNSSQINTNDKDSCILCDKMDHTSFYCQMICKNCGAQYHNLKNCPKPANLSMMLQNFLEFCLNQCTLYNPDQRFSFHNGNVQTELLPAVVPSSTRHLNNHNNNFSIPNEYTGLTKSKKISLKSQSESLNNSKLSNSFKNKIDSDSSEENNSTDASSSIETTSSRRKHKRQKIQPTIQNNTTSYPAGMGFPNPFTFNPMMAAVYSQMMGFNPTAAMNFTANLNKEK